jgi:hypothetical protein
MREAEQQRRRSEWLAARVDLDEDSPSSTSSEEEPGPPRRASSPLVSITIGSSPDRSAIDAAAHSNIQAFGSLSNLDNWTSEYSSDVADSGSTPSLINELSELPEIPWQQLVNPPTPDADRFDWSIINSLIRNSSDGDTIQASSAESVSARTNSWMWPPGSIDDSTSTSSGPDDPLPQEEPVPQPDPQGEGAPINQSATSDSGSEVEDLDICAESPLMQPAANALDLNFVPSFKPVRTDVDSIARIVPDKIRSIIMGKNVCCYLTRNRSAGPKHYVDSASAACIDHFITALLSAGLITPCKRGSFVSYPFLVPKANGEPRMIVDFGHLRGLYQKPPMHLPAFSHVLKAKAPILRYDWLVRLDLSNAFYSVPLPKQFKTMSAFRVKTKTYQWNVLPMGLYVSPAILQSVVQSVLEDIDCFHWTHVDDILFASQDRAHLLVCLTTAIRKLHEAGFNVNFRKSMMTPARSVKYCGLIIDSNSDTYDISKGKLHWINQFFFSERRQHPRCLGYVAYWLYATGHSSGLRHMIGTHHHALWRLLSSGPWPLPRPPERLWASDASGMTIAAVDHLDRPLFVRIGPMAHIHYRELAALWLTAVLAPKYTAIFCDNLAVVHSMRRSKKTCVLTFLTSHLIVTKALSVVHIASTHNPADRWTRLHQ